MSSQASIKMPRTTSTQAGGWRVWGSAVELAALPVSILLLPFAIIWLVARKIRYWARRTELLAEYEGHKYRMERQARHSLDFL